MAKSRQKWCKKGKVSQGALENGIWKKEKRYNSGEREEKGTEKRETLERREKHKREEDDKNSKERCVTQVKRYKKTRRRENRNVER